MHGQEEQLKKMQSIVLFYPLPWCENDGGATNSQWCKFSTQLSLNHSRGRGRNKMVSLKEHQSNLKPWRVRSRIGFPLLSRNHCPRQFQSWSSLYDRLGSSHALMSSSLWKSDAKEYVFKILLSINYSPIWTSIRPWTWLCLSNGNVVHFG